MLSKTMGPKLATNLLVLGVAGTFYFGVTGLYDGTLGDHPIAIAIPIVMAIVGGVRVLQIRRKMGL